MKIFCAEIWNPISIEECEVFKNGALVVNNYGIIEDVGDFYKIRKKYLNAQILEFKDSIILPGFIDAHLHYPQLDIIGSYGKDLLGWLNEYAFKKELEVNKNINYAKDVALRFWNELLSNGVTTAAIYSTSSYKVTDFFLKHTLLRKAKCVIGKVSMDRYGPDDMLCDIQDDYYKTKTLIKKWHKKNNSIFYALTPRFALSCTKKNLSLMQQLKEEFNDIYIQTHYAENKKEIYEVKRLFKGFKTYLDIYDSFNLLGPKTLLAHGIYVNVNDLDTLYQKEVSIIHCPTSNSFLGSGIFPYKLYKKYKIKIALGSDIGAGTGVSMWKTMLEAYKLQRLSGFNFTPFELFYYATLGGAKALGLDNCIGSFSSKKQADFQIICPYKHSLLAAKFYKLNSLEEKLFSLITLADNRITYKVYIKGDCVYSF